MCKNTTPPRDGTNFSFLEQMMLTDLDSDIVCFGETWLHASATHDSHLHINGCTHFRRDRPNGTHGGLLVYARSHLRTTRRQDLECPDIECLTLELNLCTQGKMLLFFCYHPPDFPPDLFFFIVSGTTTLYQTPLEHGLPRCSTTLL